MVTDPPPPSPHSTLNETITFIIPLCFRNDSGNITVEIEITFGQDVSMSAFIRLHEAMYSNGTLGNIIIYPISDNSKRLI